MPLGQNKRFGGHVPLPDGWDVEKDVDGKPFYIDHNTKQTTWVDPRDRLTKPASFADCLGDELPYGWEQACDSKIGTYFINHLTKTNQIEDPRLKWREEQEKMLREYLADANQDLMAKKQIFMIKNERLTLANEEVQNLTEKLTHWKASGTSLNSASSGSSTKYDPDLLRADIAHARNRVMRLRKEMEHVQASVQYAEKGLEMLQQVSEKMVENQNVYNVEEAQAVMRDISELYKSVISGEKEKQDLLLSVARLKEDVLRGGLRTGSSPDVSTLLLPQERANTASQTDLSGESNSQFGELVRLKLQCNEAKNHMRQLQMELANIESQLIPGQVESDRDRLILIEEKEQLFRELRSLNLRGRPLEEVNAIQMRLRELEHDIKLEIDEANQQMAMKNIQLECNRGKCDILQKLAETAKLITQLEIKIRTLSTSTASISSGSSFGSLGSLSASSRGSQNSVALSLTDIYSMQGGQFTNPEVNLAELHRRVERILQGHRNFVSIPEDVASSSEIPFGLVCDGVSLHPVELSPLMMSMPHDRFTSKFDASCSLPSYEEHMERQKLQNFTSSQELVSCGGYSSTAAMFSSMNPTLNDLQSMVLGSDLERRTIGYNECQPSDRHHLFSSFSDCLVDKTDKTSNPPLSPISESSSGVCNVLHYGSNAQSVSAAMSDDSITGGSDSGVSESNMLYRPKDSDGLLPIEPPQVQIKIQYIRLLSALEIKIEQAKNLSAFCLPENLNTVYFRMALLPSVASSQPQLTQLQKLSNNPVFGEGFRFAVAEDNIFSKTVQVNCCCANSNLEEICCGVVLISLASFDLSTELASWYNILNINILPVDLGHVMATSCPSPLQSSEILLPHQIQQSVCDGNVEIPLEEDVGAATSTSRAVKSLSKRNRSGYRELPQSCSAVLSVKEESSDESTVISSQTSTLTRNHEAEELEGQKSKDDDDDELKQYCTMASLTGNDENESGDECEDNGETDDINEHMKDLKMKIYENVWPNEMSIAHGLAACHRNMPGYSCCTSVSHDSVKCDKETNTDPSTNEAREKNGLSRQSQDVNRSSTIRRWQTFSPTAAGVADEDLSCKLSRSGSDSSVRNRRSHFERHALERQSVRLKKSSSSVSKSSVNCSKTGNRTSIDLELDLQAHRVRLAHLNEEIVSLKELKRRLEESKEKGECEPEWLMENELLQQFLTQTDKVLPHHQRHHSLSNVDELTQRRMRKVKKEVQKLQAMNKHSQANELSFRKKMAFFTTMTSLVPVIGNDDSVATSDLTVSTSASYCQNFEDEALMNSVRAEPLDIPVMTGEMAAMILTRGPHEKLLEELENTSSDE